MNSRLVSQIIDFIQVADRPGRSLWRAAFLEWAWQTKWAWQTNGRGRPYIHALLQIVGVECKERGEWVAARAVLHSCRQAVKDVTQRLQDESDEDLSEEDPADDPLRGSGDDGEGAVMVVPGLVVLLVAAVAVALGYRLYRKHRRNVRATLAPFCCGCCGTVPPVTTLGNNHHHSLQHRHLPNADNDSDTETEL